MNERKVENRMRGDNENWGVRQRIPQERKRPDEQTKKVRSDKNERPGKGEKKKKKKEGEEMTGREEDLTQ